MDPRDLEKTYRRFFPVIVAKCTRMLRDPVEAQDLAQETFTRLWAQRASLRDDDAALAWIYRTATHLALDRIRRKRVASAALLFDADEPTNESARVEARQALDRLVAHLDERELEALVLSRVDGLTHREIGEVLGTSDRTVRRILDQADVGVRESVGAP